MSYQIFIRTTTKPKNPDHADLIKWHQFGESCSDQESVEEILPRALYMYAQQDVFVFKGVSVGIKHEIRVDR